ncbi:serine/threonine protein kinase [Antricoccus suffuscus]|uniref:non-specific serine/threonine protein kinase n=1 Tax=Antricoccus suffuscus TaxID=1629062 RepID=A0A2T0ZCG7_9ACTN|nr:serine/threonine-protein kinase [Antricoccus suffuscus]PRZ33874.1 serine/threonine protein kinase [Antricoccus suffuscus]
MSDDRENRPTVPPTGGAASSVDPAGTPHLQQTPPGHLHESQATGTHAVPAPLPTATSTGDGQKLLAGRYRLESLLGRGSMGAVWRAHDVILRRSVAVKEVILPPTQTKEENDVARERALREARAIAALSHPNVVTLFDVVEEDGRPWVVMELVPALSLAQIIHDKGPLEPAETARIGLAVLGALDAAHQVGITHRDVKPGNILVSDDGRIKLADFGISRKVDESQLTRTGLMVGSPSYIAPEVARGKEAGRPADIWGLGATMHCAVEGTPPFDLGDPVATLTAVVGDPPRPAPHAGPLGPILASTLIKDPRERIKTDDLREALAAVASRRSRPSQQTRTAAPILPPGAPRGGPSSGRPAQPVPPRPTPGPESAPNPRAQGGTRTMGAVGAGGTSVRPAMSRPAPRSGAPYQQPLRSGPPSHPHPGGTGIHPSAAPLPQPPRSTNRRKVIGAAIAAILIVAIAAAVTVFVMNRDSGKSTGSTGPGGSAGSSSQSASMSTPSASPAQISNGVATGSVVVDGQAHSFSFDIPDKWVVESTDSSRADYVDSKGPDKANKQTKITIIADPLAKGGSVVTTVQDKMSQTGSPAQLPDYQKLKFQTTTDDRVLWEYENTLDGKPRHGYLYAVGDGEVVWQVILSGPSNNGAKLADLANSVKDSFQPK